MKYKYSIEAILGETLAAIAKHIVVDGYEIVVPFLIYGIGDIEMKLDSHTRSLLRKCKMMSAVIENITTVDDIEFIGYWGKNIFKRKPNMDKIIKILKEGHRRLNNIYIHFTTVDEAILFLNRVGLVELVEQHTAQEILENVQKRQYEYWIERKNGHAMTNNFRDLWRWQWKESRPVVSHEDNSSDFLLMMAESCDNYWVGYQSQR